MHLAAICILPDSSSHVPFSVTYTNELSSSEDNLRLLTAAAIFPLSHAIHFLLQLCATAGRVPAPQKKSAHISPSLLVLSMILFIRASGFCVAYPVRSSAVRPTMFICHTSLTFTSVYHPCSSSYSFTPLKRYGFRPRL